MKILIILVVSFLPAFLAAMSTDDMAAAEQKVTQILASEPSFAGASAATLALPEISALTVDEAMGLSAAPGPTALQFAGIAVLERRAEEAVAFEQALLVILRSASPASKLHDPVHDYLLKPVRWSAYSAVYPRIAGEFKTFINTVSVLDHMPNDIALSMLRSDSIAMATAAYKAILLSKLLDGKLLTLEDKDARKVWKSLKHEAGNAGVIYTTYDTKENGGALKRLAEALKDESAEEILIMSLAAHRASVIRKHIDIDSLKTSNERKEAIRAAIE